MTVLTDYLQASHNYLQHCLSSKSAY